MNKNPPINFFYFKKKNKKLFLYTLHPKVFLWRELKKKMEQPFDKDAELQDLENDDIKIEALSAQARSKMEAVANTRQFQKGVENVPFADIEAVKPHCNPPMCDREIAFLLANNRWSNKICDNCWDKKDPDTLMVCGKCYLTFYCSRECQKAHFRTHKLRCQNLHGPLDQGPQALAFYNTKTKICQKKVK